jgi:hypothetical protein
MVVTKNAYCQPGEKINRRTTEFGVFGPSGLVPFCEINTSPWTTRPPKFAPAPKVAQRLYGPALFAGSVDFQFGFVLLNSLGRLYALEQLAPETTLVFATKPMNGPNPLKILPAILRSMDIPNPLLITDSAMFFDELHTTPEIFGECQGGTGSDAFYEWLDSRWLRHQVQPGKKVYMTRTGLGPKFGRYACEDHLEMLLAAEGYEIISPETLPLHEQIRVMQSAEKLIFSEGSALHLYALLRQPGQVSAVIQRRTSLPPVMEVQMRDRAGTPTRAIDAVEKTLWPPQRGNHLGVAELNFYKLRAELTMIGLISGQHWSDPTQEQLRQSLAAGLEKGRKLMTEEERNIWITEIRVKRKKRLAA